MGNANLKPTNSSSKNPSESVVRNMNNNEKIADDWGHFKANASSEHMMTDEEREAQSFKSRDGKEPRLGMGPERMEFDGCPNTDDGGHIGEMKEESIHYEFYGEEMLRTKAPKMMDFVDTVVGEWKHGGHFNNLPITNSGLKRKMSLALRRAKKMEKEYEERGVMAAAKMGFESLKSQFERRPEV